MEAENGSGRSPTAQIRKHPFKKCSLFSFLGVNSSPGGGLALVERSCECTCCLEKVLISDG